jgi:hypothetical protein
MIMMAESGHRAREHKLRCALDNRQNRRFLAPRAAISLFGPLFTIAKGY